MLDDPVSFHVLIFNKQTSSSHIIGCPKINSNISPGVGRVFISYPWDNNKIACRQTPISDLTSYAKIFLYKP